MDRSTQRPPMPQSGASTGAPQSLPGPRTAPQAHRDVSTSRRKSAWTRDHQQHKKAANETGECGGTFS